MRWGASALLCALAAVGIGTHELTARIRTTALVSIELQDATPRELRRILRDRNHNYKSLIEKAELLEAAAAALAEERLRAVGIAGILGDLSGRFSRPRTETLLLVGYLLLWLVLPLVIWCCWLRPVPDARRRGPRTPPWMPLHRMRAGDTIPTDNPFNHPNPLDPWRLPGPGWSTVRWVDDAADDPALAVAAAEADEEEVRNRPVCDPKSTLN